MIISHKIMHKDKGKKANISEQRINIYKMQGIQRGYAPQIFKHTYK